MPDTTCHMSISLDGFVAGPDQSRENPLGKRGREVHSWHLGDERANDADATAEGWLMRPRGAYVMGRNMFGPIRGEWDEDWDGWWGSEPPYHAPVFVLTHHAREPIEMEGGTSFHFVTEGFEAAYAQARELKIARTTETRSTCPYCSVSCGVIIHTLGDKARNVTPAVVHVEGDASSRARRSISGRRGFRPWRRRRRWR